MKYKLIYRDGDLYWYDYCELYDGSQYHEYRVERDYDGNHSSWFDNKHLPIELRLNKENPDETIEKFFKLLVLL